MNEHEKINYVEYPAKDIAATKRFFVHPLAAGRPDRRLIGSIIFIKVKFKVNLLLTI